MSEPLVDRVDPCPCLLKMFVRDPEAGARAYCQAHQLFGERQADGRVLAQSVAFARATLHTR